MPHARSITAFSALDAYFLYAYVMGKNNTDILVVKV
jgi:hypothetical protein